MSALGHFRTFGPLSAMAVEPRKRTLVSDLELPLSANSGMTGSGSGRKGKRKLDLRRKGPAVRASFGQLNIHTIFAIGLTATDNRRRID